MSKKQSAIIYSFLCFATSSIAIVDPGVSRITPTPVLQARGAFQTAGFISGHPDSPITCPGTSTVSKGPQYAFGCCDVTCWKPATCQTNGQPSCGPNCVYSQITTCTDEASPSCAKYILKTGIDDENPHTSFLCLPEATDILVYVDATGSSGSGSTVAGNSDIPGETSGSSADNSNKDGGSGLTGDQKIALGVGIGVGVPAVIVAFLAWWWPRKSQW